MYTIKKTNDKTYYNWILDDAFGEQATVSWRDGNSVVFIYIKRNNAEMWHMIPLPALQEFINEFQSLIKR